MLKLLTDAMENGWPVSWLPELAESVHILAFNMRTINALDVTTYASSTREYMPPSTWLLTVHFR